MFFFGIKSLFKFIIVLPIIIILLLIIGKIFFLDNITKPNLTLRDGITLEKINNNEIVLKTTAKLELAKLININLQKSTIDVMYNKNKIGKAELETVMGDDSVKQISINFYIQNERLISSFAESTKDSKIFLKGKLIAKAGMLKIPFDINIPLPIDLNNDLINPLIVNTDLVDVVDVKITGVGVNKPAILVTFKINNNLKMNFSVNKSTSKLFINGTEAGKGELVDRVIVLNNQKTVLGKIRINLNKEYMQNKFENDLLTQRLIYKIVGELIITKDNNSFSIPFSNSGNLLE